MLVYIFKYLRTTVLVTDKTKAPGVKIKINCCRRRRRRRQHGWLFSKALQDDLMYTITSNSCFSFIL